MLAQSGIDELSPGGVWGEARDSDWGLAPTAWASSTANRPSGTAAASSRRKRRPGECKAPDNLGMSYADQFSDERQSFGKKTHISRSSIHGWVQGAPLYLTSNVQQPDPERDPLHCLIRQRRDTNNLPPPNHHTARRHRQLGSAVEEASRG